jgi:hypothetical protein
MTQSPQGSSDAPTDVMLIREHLEALGLSQREGARKLGIDDRTMRYFCSGRKSVPAAVMLALAQLRSGTGNADSNSAPHAFPTVLEPETALSTVQGMRSRFAPWFALATDAHQIATEVLPLLRPPTTDNARLIAAALYGRIVTSFQSIYILSERGLCGDARTVLRSFAESAIVLAALVADPKRVSDLLVDREIVNERKILAAWLEDPQAAEHLTPEQLKNFANRLAESRATYRAVKDDPVNVNQLARSSGMLWLYNTAFRMHSGDAAHTSLLSLERHVKSNDKAEITGLRFGPHAEEVRNTLSNAIAPLLNATHSAILFFDLMHYKAELDKILAAWQALSSSGEQRSGA